VTATAPGPGSVALITGGTGGFGRALASKLRERGVTVVLADLDSERNRQVAADLGCPFVALDVTDRAGVLAQVAGVFAQHGVSIATVRQEGRRGEDGALDEGDGDDGAPGPRDATLVIVTHSAPDAALAATVDALTGLDSVRGVAGVLRVEGLGRPVTELGGAS
jgi:NAD(P)-dependent dehydrogenase (short-subunit alcohol dehydrogenase family)